MTSFISIKNSDLDSNNWVELQANHFQPSYKKRVANNPIDGQFTGTSYIIATADLIGVENPIFTVKGVISSDEFSVTSDIWSITPSTITSKSVDGNSMAGQVTLGYLIALWKNMTGDTYLKINFGDIDNQLVWQNHDLNSGQIKVELQGGFNPVPREDSEGNHIIDYTLNFVETN